MRYICMIECVFPYFGVYLYIIIYMIICMCINLYICYMRIDLCTSIYLYINMTTSLFFGTLEPRTWWRAIANFLSGKVYMHNNVHVHYYMYTFIYRYVPLSSIIHHDIHVYWPLYFYILIWTWQCDSAPQQSLKWYGWLTIYMYAKHTCMYEYIWVHI